MWALALLTFTAAAGCGGKGDGAQDSAAATLASDALVLGATDVATAREGDVGATLTLSGPLEPQEKVDIRAQVGGTVRGLRVDRGSAVTRGQRLATIQAVGVQSQATGARAQVAAAEANLAVARQRRDAAEKLRAAGAMSEIDYRTAIAQYEAADAQVAAARAQAASSGEAVGYTTIESPITGVVSDRPIEDGESVRPGDALLTVVNTRMLELAGQVGVADAGRVRVGQSVTFTLDAFPGEEFKGRVARVDPTADQGTRQVGVYVELANRGGRIVGGQFARGTIATGSGGQRGVLIPVTAVQGARSDAAQGTVLVIENGRLVRRSVTLGARDQTSGMVVVTSGVRAGEQVVAVPAPEVREGTQVTLAAEGAVNVPTTAAPAARKE